MDDTKVREILRIILGLANNWTGRGVLVKELAPRFGVSFEEALDLSDQLIASGFVWACMEQGAPVVDENLRIGVSREGRWFVDGFPDPNVDVDTWFNLPNNK